MTSSPPPPPIAILRGHRNAINTLCYVTCSGGTSRYLISGDVDGCLKLWDLKLFRCIGDKIAHTSSILTAIRFESNDNPNRFISSGRDGFVKLWDIESFITGEECEPVTSINTGSLSFCNITSIPGNNCAIISSDNSTNNILIWDLRSPELPVSKIDYLSDEASKLGMVTFLNSTTNSIYSGFEDGSIHGIDLRVMRSFFKCKLHNQPVLSLDTIPIKDGNGRSMVSGGADDYLQLSTIQNVSRDLNVASHLNDNSSMKPRSCLHEKLVEQRDLERKSMQTTVDTMKKVQLPIAGTSCIRYRSDQRVMITGHWDRTIRIFDGMKMNPLAVLRHHRDAVTAIEFIQSQQSVFQEITEEGQTPKTTDGSFASASKDGTIAIWDVYKGMDTSFIHHGLVSLLCSRYV